MVYVLWRPLLGPGSCLWYCSAARDVHVGDVAVTAAACAARTQRCAQRDCQSLETHASVVRWHHSRCKLQSKSRAMCPLYTAYGSVLQSSLATLACTHCVLHRLSTSLASRPWFLRMHAAYNGATCDHSLLFHNASCPPHCSQTRPWKAAAMCELLVCACALERCVVALLFNVQKTISQPASEPFCRAPASIDACHRVTWSFVRSCVRACDFSA